MTLRSNHIVAFFGYVIREYRLAKWALASTALLLVLEYASLSLMMPLSVSAAQGPKSPGSSVVNDFWVVVVRHLGLRPGLVTWLWLFLVLMTLRTMAGYGHQLLTTYVSKQVHRQLSENVFRRVLCDEPMTQIYKRSVGFYISLAGDDTFRAGSLVNFALLMLGASVSALAGLVLLFVFSPGLFPATIAFLLLSSAVIAMTTRRMLRLNAASVDGSRELSTAFLEALNSLRSVRSMSSEDFVRHAYAAQMANYTHLLFLVEAVKSGIRFVPGIVALVTGIVLLGPWWTTSPILSAGTAFGALTILLRVFASLGALMAAGGALLVDARAATDLGELTRFPKGNEATPATATAPVAPLVGDIALSEVDYAYDGSQKVLDKLSFRMSPGRCYAVIGPSGSGKSTLADILLGMIEPQTGKVEIGGHIVTSGELRRRVVLVEQQPRIFSVSLRDNLTLGLSVDNDELMMVLTAVEMAEYTESLPDGLETVYEYQGANLSGGQRQRLSIARALLRHPHVLILDEATSALDAATRDIVVMRLKRFMRQGVILFITHDETIAGLADEVISLKRPVS